MEREAVIETKRLLLRNFQEEDCFALHELLKDEEVNTYLPWWPSTSLEDTKKFLEAKVYLEYQRNGYFYAITHKTTGEVIGYVNISSKHHDIGYGLRQKDWHKGIVTEACLAVLEVVKKAQLPFVIATHDRNNYRSGSVMKAIGMQYQYSYEEVVQPKNNHVIFRLYQLNFDPEDTYVYHEPWVDAFPQFLEDLSEEEKKSHS